MDQDSFRKLLQTPSTSTSSRAPLAAKPAKLKPVSSSQPTFKPRTIKKKQNDAYRDRASERRLGLDNDYAEVEALAEDFERRAAQAADRKAIEEQRKYLGGDSTHSVLVKGLDFALLEQNRARAAAAEASTTDASLEQAFLEAGPAKRTREDIVRELKSKRTASVPDESSQASASMDVALEEAKKAGKFKPIGFKPVGGSAANGDKPKRKKKTKASEEPAERRKKRKVVVEASPPPLAPDAVPSASTSQLPSPPPAPEPEPESADYDFDIFAGAGEYTGVDLGDDSESEGGQSDVERRARSPGSHIEGANDGPQEHSPQPRGNWFAPAEDAALPPVVDDMQEPTLARAMVEEGEGEEDEEETGGPVRLQPLASSVLPSIKDLLALDEEADKTKKRRARKEKKRGGGGAEGKVDKAKVDKAKVDKAKVDRDYQRLKAYTEKKAATGKT
ncbi:Protein Red [Grifola frondosa]|uniref:Protein Red n=1 Tax=Grifola frondosa TaxID=5627 RepID=A0A1C7MAX7_GRIFR|nr:Protein Red [Grifola frondosa]